MGYRVKHYAAPTSGADFKSNWEAIVTEILVGIISLGMAITGYQGQLILMYVPLFFVSGMCFLMAIHGIVSGIVQRRAAKKLADSKKASRR